MGLRDLVYQYSYDSDSCDLVIEFYDKVLSETIEYKRLAGFFSSKSFAVAAEGIRGLIDNNGVMKMVVSPRLSKEDADMLKLAYTDPEKAISKSMISSIEEAKDSLENDYISAMGWMIANKYLEMKIAVVYDDAGNVMSSEEIEENGLFHIKTGILKDSNGDIVSFSGSINESATGWARNTEQFEVHRMWEVGHEGFCQDQIKRFEAYWNGINGRTKVFDIPEAAKQKILERATDDIDQISCLQRRRKRKEILKYKSDIPLYFYQEEALNKWIDSGYRMLFQMATGTGKTRTAIACMDHLLKREKKLLTIVVCPQNTLSLQWMEEIKKLNITCGSMIIADSSNSKWRAQFEECLLDINFGTYRNGIIFACSKTFCGRDFISIVNKYGEKIPFLLIGDEAHGLGASETSKGLLETYKYRIGLSATPSRWFDNFGTRVIEDYFGNASYEFTIYQALHTEKPGTGKSYLTPYHYEPIYVNLTEEEIFSYEEVTTKIKRISHFKEDREDAQKQYEMLLMARADIYKNAYNKYEELTKLLDRKNIRDNIEDTIIFVSDEQIDDVMNILSKMKIVAKRYTKDTGSRPLKKYHGKTERQYVIEEFANHTIQVLVAIKCLDEGIDIPGAKRAIIMASSSNPREFIQRVGRVIRTAEGKERAEIYDLTVVPDIRCINSELLRFELDVFDKEQNRILDISRNSENSVQVLRKIDEIQRRIHGWS